MKFNKQKMINKLERAKELVSEVYDETGADIGGVLCDIDEAIGEVDECENLQPNK